MSTTLIALALVACTGEAAETPAVPALGVTLHEDALALTALAWEAIARSPAWLTDALDDLQIVDVGEPVVDPDDHSVTTYRVGSESGEVVERTVDRETSWTSGSTR